MKEEGGQEDGVGQWDKESKTQETPGGRDETTRP